MLFSTIDIISKDVFLAHSETAELRKQVIFSAIELAIEELSGRRRQNETNAEALAGFFFSGV